MSRAYMGRAYLQGRQIALAVGGGIAAYKACELARELMRAGAVVRVAMTPAAQQFVTPLTFQSLTGHPVFTDTFDPAQDSAFGHLQLPRWADLFIVAPATADLISRLAAGIANDAVTTALCAFRGPVLLAPAMNTAMWANEALQASLQRLTAQPRFRVVGPDSGLLADGDVGPGRLSELDAILEAADALSYVGPLSGKRVLITSGPTREFFDPVRFISNPSSGKMGAALADVARGRGATVTVVLGPGAVPPRSSVEIVPVVSADDMAKAVLSRIDACDIFVAAAAVSDFRPAQRAPQKLKKTESDEQVTLVRTPDVLALASAYVQSKPTRPLLVGFAAETQDVVLNARTKLEKKKLDAIVANDVSSQSAGFEADVNRVTVIAKERQVDISGTKRSVASGIWDVLSEPFAK